MPVLSNYDAWKLATPPEYEWPEGEPEPDPCDHSEYEFDVLTGRACCCMCDHVWYPTAEQIARHEQQAKEYDEMIRCNGCRPAPAFRAEPINDEIPF